ncbi:hypothetical protein HZA97_02035 [Candidatus Woesearchaeota archaeon]|nr:hypothetical protein [Candidatus Woesearchaeota archaeon]
MEYKLSLISLLVVLLFLSACSGMTDVTSLVKTFPEVQNFLEQYPDADLRVVYWSNSAVQENIAVVRSDCGDQVQVQPYWNVKVKKGELTLQLWLDGDTKQPICIIKKATHSSSKSQENNTQQAESKSQQNFKDVEKQKSELPNTNLEAQNKELISKINLLLTQNNVYKSSTEDLNNKLTSCQAKYQEEKTEKDKVAKEKDQYKLRSDDLEIQTNNLKTKNQQLEFTNANLEATNKQIQGKVNELIALINSYKDNVNSLSTSLASCKSSLTTCQNS